MVFSSINPNIYLDPTSWQVEHNQQTTTEARGTNVSSHQFLSSPLQPPQAGGCNTGDATNYSFRSSGSMTERARLAKVPLPEPGLNCPRCDSTNTKFCYFNNYNLSQPRHFCKACRRYWTRGGALRNVPVGGGCRRNNKRNKGSSTHKRSKSPLAAHEQSSFSGGGTDNILSQIPTGAPALTLLPPLDHLGEYNSMEREPSLLGGLRVPASSMAGFHQVAAGSSNSSGFLEQFRSLQQQLHHPTFPFLTSFGLVPPPSTTAVYSFDGDGAQPGSYGGPVRFKAVEDPVVMKTGDDQNNLPAGVNMSKNMREISGAAGDGQIWSGNSNNIINAWTDLSGFSNSCTSNDH